MIALTLLRRRVNQLIFFPSYNYLNFIYPRVRQRLEGEDIDLILQRRLWTTDIGNYFKTV